ncbi:MAG TPA: polyprenol monophosphomannose synthase [Gaiellales bacterium]|nr:polyprenol monophosphomannose synthase [Gaiellales bacterium]
MADTPIVVVPTYNEVEMLPIFLDAFAMVGYECLVVDDSSPDGTGELADRLARERPWLHVLHRDAKEGLGAAYRSGFAWALERGHRRIGQMDCDLSHPPSALPRMTAEVDRGAGLVLGSRYVRGGGTRGWSFGRRVISRTGCATAKTLLHLPYPDLSGGFKLWTAEALHRIEVETTVSNGYVFQVETTRRAHIAGVRIAQVPFVFVERLVGESKMSPAIAREGARILLQLRRDDWRPPAEPVARLRAVDARGVTGG